MEYKELWKDESLLYPLFGESVSGDKNHDTWVEWWQVYDEASNKTTFFAAGGYGDEIRKTLEI